MTISYNTSTINSLSTDVKPTNVPTGIICNETDTLKIFIFNGSTWDELTRQTNTDNKEPNDKP